MRPKPRKFLGTGLNRRRFLVAAALVAASAAGVLWYAVDRGAGRREPGGGTQVMTAEDSEVLERMWSKVGTRLTMHSLVSTPAVNESLPVILVHGLALSGRYMIPTAERLAATHKVYVPDFPGFGESDKPPVILDVPDMADALARWMEAVGLDTALFLGNSFGCQIIADFAARYPGKIAAGVLQGPTTPPDERSWFWQFVRWQQNSPYNPPSMGEIAGSDYRKCGYVRALRTFHFSLLDRIETKLPRIAAPMLIVRGSLDPICRQAWAETVTSLVPDARLEIIPGVAHTLCYTAPRELVEACRPFLSETGGAAG